jgi:hypothetical protein
MSFTVVAKCFKRDSDNHLITFNISDKNNSDEKMERLNGLIDRIAENGLKTSLRRSKKYGNCLLWFSIYEKNHIFNEGFKYELTLGVRNPNKSGYVNFTIRSWNEWVAKSKYDFLNL